MYQLPDVLIDYIYSFDCNTYYKTKYNAVMREINHKYSWRRTQKFLQHKHSTYSIYYEYQLRTNPRPAMSLTQYILSVSKKYGDCVIVDDMRWMLWTELRKKREIWFCCGFVGFGFLLIFLKNWSFFCNCSTKTYSLLLQQQQQQ